MPPRKRTRRGFGQIRKLPSGRFQARYSDPTGAMTASGDIIRHTAPVTFETMLDAEGWLHREHRLITDGEWTPPAARKAAAEESARQAAQVLTFATYAETWLRDRDIKPRTRQHYRRILDVHLLPVFGPTPLEDITPTMVRAWHAKMGNSTPTLRAHSYGLLRTILGTAASDGLISANPCHIRGAGNAKRVHKIKPLTLDELTVLVDAMPERLRAMALLATWCGLRFGELAELRRPDVDLQAGVLHVRRGVVWVDGKAIIGAPKTAAGVRDVAIPPHLIPVLKDHMARFVPQVPKGSLLFPGKGGENLRPSTLYGKASSHGFYFAREQAGRPDLRWHDLRHTGAVLAAQTGATLAELMARLGHSTPGAAMKYQHAAEQRDLVIAQRLSVLATGAAVTS